MSLSLPNALPFAAANPCPLPRGREPGSRPRAAAVKILAFVDGARDLTRLQFDG
jgi:hypothetical protein